MVAPPSENVYQASGVSNVQYGRGFIKTNKNFVNRIASTYISNDTASVSEARQ